MTSTVRRLAAMWRAVARQGALGLGAVLLGVAALTSSGGWLHTEVAAREAENEQRDHLNDLRSRNRALTVQLEVLTDSLACRSEAATEAENIQAEMTSWIGSGLAALAREDEAGFRHATDEVSRLSGDLGPALDRRADAIEDCDGG